MAAAKSCTDAIGILWEILDLMAQGKIEKETVKHWMTLSAGDLKQITTLAEQKRVSAGMSKAAESYLMLMRCKLQLCMQNQSQINAAGSGPLQQQQPEQEENINQNMPIKFESPVTSSFQKLLTEINAATSTTSTPTSPTKSNLDLSTNGITTTPTKSTRDPPVKRLKVHSTTEDDSNNHECDRSTVAETNESPRIMYYGLPKKSLYELENKYMYQITILREVKTPYGPSVVAHLDDKYQLFLPRHLAQSYLDNMDAFEKAKKSIIKKELYLMNDRDTCNIFNIST